MLLYIDFCFYDFPFNKIVKMADRNTILSENKEAKKAIRRNILPFVKLLEKKVRISYNKFFVVFLTCEIFERLPQRLINMPA